MDSKVRREQQQDHQDRNGKPYGQVSENLPHGADLPSDLRGHSLLAGCQPERSPGRCQRQLGLDRSCQDSLKARSSKVRFVGQLAGYAAGSHGSHLG